MTEKWKISAESDLISGTNTLALKTKIELCGCLIPRKLNIEVIYDTESGRDEIGLNLNDQHRFYFYHLHTSFTEKNRLFKMNSESFYE